MTPSGVPRGACRTATMRWCWGRLPSCPDVIDAGGATAPEYRPADAYRPAPRRSGAASRSRRARFRAARTLLVPDDDPQALGQGRRYAGELPAADDGAPQ